MREPRAYGIELSKLALGMHRFDFAVGSAFFAQRPHSPLAEVAVDIVAHVDKTSRHVDVRFALRGWVSLECDRCLRAYNQPVEAQFRVIYTYERGLRETDEAEVIWIDRNTPFLDFADEFYEFIVLQMPQRRIPPDCPTAACAPFLARIANAQPDASSTDDLPPDSPWQALEQFRKHFPNSN